MYINGLGYMTKMATRPIFGKTLKKLLLQNRMSNDLETWHAKSGTQALQSFYKNNPGATLTYLTTRSNLVTWAFYYIWKKVKTVNFLGTINPCDLKVGR